ncbi:hypothetical protein IKI14_03960 [bacterium]|nr:hypothetical protein [bacterium]
MSVYHVELNAYLYEVDLLYATDVNLNDSGKSVILQFLLKLYKKSDSTVVILLVSNDHSGKLVICQLLLNQLKKLFPTFVILLVSNEPSGRLVSAH